MQNRKNSAPQTPQSSHKAMNKRKKKAANASDKPLQALAVLESLGCAGVCCGLANLGNTCFANSVLQILAHQPQLRAHAVRRIHSTLCKHTESTGQPCIFCLFEELVTEMVSPSSVQNTVYPRNLLHNIHLVGKQFTLGYQQDAHEFFLCLVDALDACELRHFSPEERKVQAQNTTSAQIFGGKILSRVECSNCALTSDTSSLSLDLSIDLSSSNPHSPANCGVKMNGSGGESRLENWTQNGACNSAPTNTVSIEEGIRNFFAVEKLTVEDGYICGKCQISVPATKRFVFVEVPAVLCVHLKRFSPLGKKISRHVTFQPTLDLQKCMEVSQDNKSKKDFEYILTGMVVHNGTVVSRGHYVSYVKTLEGFWVYYDDDSVYSVDESYVLKQSPYLLFYTQASIAKFKSAQRAQTHQFVAPQFLPYKPRGLPRPQNQFFRGVLFVLVIVVCVWFVMSFLAADSSRSGANVRRDHSMRTHARF